MEREVKIYRWIIMILLVTNLATIGSVLYHVYSEKPTTGSQNMEMPIEQRTRFFIEQLNLDAQQAEQFRNLNRSFNRTANPITHQLENLRLNMLEELANDKPDKNKLDEYANEIGNMHSQLKKTTIDFYLQMKLICNSEQQTKLYQIFHSMLHQEENVKLPRGRHQGERGRNSSNN